MTVQAWFLYVTLVLVATASPGPAVLFIVTNSTLHGWKKSMFAALGNISGLFCLGLLAVTGLGGIIRASEVAFHLVKFTGAAYLICLGLKLIFTKASSKAGAQDQPACAKGRPLRIFWQAWGVAVSNPKAIVFLTALFPQFIDINKALVPQFSTLIAVLMLFSFLFLMMYALLAHSLSRYVVKPAATKLFRRVSGTIFVGFGALLASAARE